MAVYYFMSIFESIIINGLALIVHKLFLFPYCTIVTPFLQREFLCTYIYCKREKVVFLRSAKVFPINLLLQA